jgi:urease accessory protein
MTLYLRTLLSRDAEANRSLTLPFERRAKSRFRARLDDGADAALVLPRGTVLRNGDKLRADDGSTVVVIAAEEHLSTVASADAWLLARAAYHLGNRHVPLQIEPGCLRYEHDHVLDDLVRGLGLEVAVQRGPFEPEHGSYGSGRHHHVSGHGHHDHDHDHEADT